MAVIVFASTRLMATVSDPNGRLPEIRYVLAAKIGRVAVRDRTAICGNSLVGDVQAVTFRHYSTGFAFWVVVRQSTSTSVRPEKLVNSKQNDGTDLIGDQTKATLEMGET
jgi:hypothetical protein